MQFSHIYGHSKFVKVERKVNGGIDKENDLHGLKWKKQVNLDQEEIVEKFS